MSDEERHSGDDASEERRLFGEQLATRTGFIACDLGVARVSLAGGRVGHVSLVKRCTATSVAVGQEQVVAGTVRGVLVDEGDGFDRFGEAFEVVAVGLTGDGRALAGGADGRVVAWQPDQGWESLGAVTEPQRFDGEFLAAGDGVYRVTESLEHLGLSSAHDVAAVDGLLAATEDGLYRQDAESGEWHHEHDRPVATVVAADGQAHAIDDRDILERVDGAWERRDVPQLAVDLAYGKEPCAITADGTLLVNASSETSAGDREWRSHPLGLLGVVEFVVQ